MRQLFSDLRRGLVIGVGFVLLVSVSVGLVLAFTDTFDVTTPAGTADPTQGDDRIRELKRAIQQRMNVDHDWAQSGDTVDASDVGQHVVAQFQDQGSNPSATAAIGKLFSKQVSAHSEMHWIDDDGSVTQMTTNGAVNAQVPSGIIVLADSACPAGYTRVSALDGKFLVSDATYSAAAGGSNTHTHTGPSHTHSVSGSGWSTGTPSQTLTEVSAGKSGETFERLGSVTSGASGTAATGSTDGRPAYATLLLCKKD